MKNNEPKNKTMKITTKKECPYCGSDKIVSTGMRGGAGPSMQVTTELYTCVKCGEKFEGPIGLERKW